MAGENAGRETSRLVIHTLAGAFGPFLGLITLTLSFAILTRASGQFLTVFNWQTIAVQTVIVGIAALGMTLVMIAGGIDLSVGSGIALVTVFVGVLVRDAKVPMILAMVGGVGLGGVCGLFNGGLITGLGVVPFIITLGTLKVYRGLAKWAASSTIVYIEDPLARPWWLDQVMTTDPKPSWLMVAPGVWLLLILSLWVAGILRYAILGRYVYAIGSNEATARLCGVNVPAAKLSVYGLAGLFTGLAGVMQFCVMNGAGDPVTADGLELQVIAAVVIGGGSLSGGEGTVLGTLIGCLFMSVLNNGCVHAGIPNAAQDVIIGVIIVTAVTLDRLRNR